MRQSRLKIVAGLVLAATLASCGGGGREPTADGVVVIHDSGIVPQSFPTDSPISVQIQAAKPINVTITQGQTLTITVDATGSAPLVYSWRWSRKNEFMPGQNASSLVISNIQKSDEGSYSVSVTNNTNSIAISGFVNVTVVPHVDPTPNPQP